MAAEHKLRGCLLRGAFILFLLSPIAAWFLYPVATRWFLSGPKLRSLINAQPELLMMDWDEAVSRRPGRLTLKNLRIRGSDPNVQWIIRLDSAEVDFSMLALAKNTFKATRLQGTGLSFFLRNKIQPSAVKSTDVSVLPPVPGFSDPPLRAPDAPMPPPDPKVWLIDVRNIAIAHFDDIWVDAYHFTGGARVDGSFRLRPGILAQIGPAKLTFENGEVRIGKASEGISVVGTVDALFDPFAPLEHPNSKVFEVLSGEVKLEGSFQKLQSLQHLFQQSGARLQAGRGKATIAGTIDHGIAKGGLRAEVRNADVKLETSTLQGNTDIHVRIPRWNLVTGPIDISGSRVKVFDTRAVGSADDRFWSGQFDVPSGKIDVTTTATVEAKTQDARPMLAALGAPLPFWTKPLLQLEDFSGSARATLGPTVTRIQDLDAVGGSFHVRGHYSRDKGVTDGAFLIESGILTVAVELDGKKANVRPFFAKTWFEKQGDGSAASKKAAAGK